MFIQLFSQTMTQMEAMLPVDTNIREAYSNGHDAEQQFIQDLALFFCAYLKGTIINENSRNLPNLGEPPPP